MSFFSKGTLRKAFLAVAMVTTVAGVAPQPAQASPVVASSVASSAAASAAVAAAAAANARHNREAQNAYIVNPSDENMVRLSHRGLIDSTTAPYLREAVADLKIAPGAKESDVTEAQRDRFMTLLQEKKLIGEMSAATPEEAVNRGMSESLAPYFTQTKTELGYSSNLDLTQAKAVESVMKGKHWTNHTKPMLEKSAAIGAGIAVVGALGIMGYGMVSTNRKRDFGY